MKDEQTTVIEFSTPVRIVLGIIAVCMLANGVMAIIGCVSK